MCFPRLVFVVRHIETYIMGTRAITSTSSYRSRWNLTSNTTNVGEAFGPGVAPSSEQMDKDHRKAHNHVFPNCDMGGKAQHFARIDIAHESSMKGYAPFH